MQVPPWLVGSRVAARADHILLHHDRVVDVDDHGGRILARGSTDAIPAPLALAFGVVAIGLVLIFLSYDRARSLKAVSEIAKTGVAVSPESEPALDKGGLSIVQPQGGIQGSTTLTVGSSASYQVQPSDGATYAWKVDGPGTVSPPDQPTTTLTASGPGTVTLSVTVTPKTGSASKPVSLPIKVVASPKPAPTMDKVPFLGSGYGTVVILLAVASVTAALGLTDVLNGQAVAGVLASIVTYSVARAAGAAGGAASSGKASGGSSAKGGS